MSPANYQRELLLCSLHQAGAPTSAAELCDAMSSLALEAYADKDQWATLTTASVAGLLRVLQREGLVVADGSERDSRQGRAVPTWRPAAGFDQDYPVPMPRSQPDPAGGDLPRQELAPCSPYAGLTPVKARALLAIHDRIFEATARRQAAVDAAEREFQVTLERERRALLQLGFEA